MVGGGGGDFNLSEQAAECIRCWQHARIYPLRSRSFNISPPLFIITMCMMYIVRVASKSLGCL